MMKTKNLLLIAIATGVLSGGLLTALFPNEYWFAGWVSSAVLITAAVFVLLLSWKSTKTGQKGLWLTIAAFTVRLIIGVSLMLILPVWGYETEQQQAGYPFRDAFNRDTASWQLASSDDSLFTVFNEEFFTDQYGGLSFISALVYRVFSRDIHRPYLMLILASFAFAVGVPFFYTAIKKRWDGKLALIASWFVVLYPEGIFFTSSQMREPFIIGGAMILIWGLLSWFEQEKRKQVLLICLPVIVLMVAISWLMCGAILLLLGGWFVIEWIQHNLPLEKQKRSYILLFVSILVLLVGFVFINREWLGVTIWWDMGEMVRNSGFVQYLVEDSPPAVQYSFITIYGVLQMIPPAALIETSSVLWKVIAVLRSFGWYAYLPVLIFGLYAIWKKEAKKDRIIIIWLLLFTWGWIIFSSIRGGGDSWDNPRYRMAVLPIMSFLVVYLYRLRDHWFWRLVAIVGFSLLLFTQWYMARYWHFLSALSIPIMVLVIVGFSFFVIISGVWVERKRFKQNID